ncbi:glycoside hydrolase family 5 protein [Zemynaea arenosa]|nr:cellulase family glycosylhydrolase [Massilia arenosa]
MAGMTKWRQMAGLILLAACAVSTCEAAAAKPAPITGPQHMLHAQGTKWVRADGTQVNLKGANLGNWLINEFWMMGQGSHGIDDECKLEEVLDHRFGYQERQRLFRLYRDNWITTKDWDMLASFGLNVVRVPFIHTVVEDEKNPGHLRADAWRYLDDAIAQAEKRGMYVILDLHGAAGSQGWEHHSGCAGLNQFWSTPAYQQRSIWLWQQIAARYKDRSSVAGYSLLNEPWGTPPENMADVITTMYKAVRAVDPNHIIILPGHHTGIGAYGDPAKRGMVNVAFEMHPYPGHFGWGEPGPAVHRGWLLCTDEKSDTVCAWDQRMKSLNTPLYFGEVQPWAKMGLETGGQVARASFDTYARYGWAVTAWSYKYVSNEGGHGQGTWGMVTNAAGERVPDLDFNTASLAQIESLFKRFGTMRYEPHGPLKRWLTSPIPPDPFGLTRPHEESK